MSVLSFPDRGPWGDNKYRGNCSGHIYRHLFAQLQPRTFVDPMVGSGTSVEVATELGIEALGLDLHSGFNALRDPIRERLPRHWADGADLVFSHPAYHTMIRYSGNVWGAEPHPDDLSQCRSVDEFYEKLTQAILNQRDATRPGGVYGFLLGDLRQQGQYFALASDMQAYLPRRELRAIQIKAQHNTWSGGQAYGRLRFGRIEHEYIVLYERLTGGVYACLAAAVQQQRQVAGGTWRAIVRHAIQALGKTQFTVQEVYRVVFDTAPERVSSNVHWEAKVRQTIQALPELQGQGQGHWTVAAPLTAA